MEFRRFFEKYKERIILIALVLIIAIFIGIRITIYQYDGFGTYFAASYICQFLVGSVVIAIGVMICYALLVMMPPVKMRWLLSGICIVSFLFLIGLVLEMYGVEFSIIQYKQIKLGNLEIDKRWLYDVAVIVIFPCILLFLQSALKQQDSKNNRWLSGVIVLLFTLIEFLIFEQLSNTWLFTAAVLNVISVTTFLFSISNVGEQRIRKCICRSCLYGLFWFFLLVLQQGGIVTFDRFMYGYGWHTRNANIGNLLSESVLIGTSDSLIRLVENGLDLSFVLSNPIQYLLYYGGWMPAFIYLFMLCVFIWIMYYFLGKNSWKENPRYILYQAAFANLFLRVVAGVLYSFGIWAYPVSLPFAGTYGFIMDSMSVILLLFCRYENWLREKWEDIILDDEFEDEYQYSEDFPLTFSEKES